MKECLIVGKGPSAVNAYSHMDGCPVVSINDAMKLFDGPVAYCFFTDFPLAEETRPYWDRVERFVCPTSLHFRLPLSEPYPIEHLLPKGLPRDRLTRYAYEPCDRTLSTFQERVKARQITHHSTATAAMSFLAYVGFTKLKLIGFDGGTDLAPDVTRGMPEGFNYDTFRRAQATLAMVLKEQLGVTTEWLS